MDAVSGRTLGQRRRHLDGNGVAHQRYQVVCRIFHAERVARRSYPHDVLTGANVESVERHGFSVGNQELKRQKNRRTLVLRHQIWRRRAGTGFKKAAGFIPDTVDLDFRYLSKVATKCQGACAPVEYLHFKAR